MARCPSCHRRLAAGVGSAFESGEAPVVARFEIEGMLGSGGFATTWAARTADGRRAAVKVSRVPSRAAAERLERIGRNKRVFGDRVVARSAGVGGASPR